MLKQCKIKVFGSFIELGGLCNKAHNLSNDVTLENT